MEIYPLAITQPEWRIFIDTCQQHLGLSPTRGLDLVSMDVKDPASFLGCLDMENRPLDSLRMPGHPFRHYSMSFIAVVNEDELLELMDTDLAITKKRGKRKFVAILSGDMLTWYSTVLSACRKETPYELRACMNIVVAHLERAGFREMFQSLTKHQIGDGTFILRK